MELVLVTRFPQVADFFSTDYSHQGDDFTQAYRERRRHYYNRFPMFWGTFPGCHTEEFAIYGALGVTREQARILRTASSRLYQLLTRLAHVLQRADDQVLLDIGIPPSALRYSRIVLPEMAAVMCGRFEFAMMAEGPKLLEFNAETATFVLELFYMNSQVCRDFGLTDPNRQSQEQLAQAIHASIIAGIRWLEQPPKAKASVVFSAYSNNKEERNTTEFYQSLLGSRGSHIYRSSFRGLDELRVARDCLLTADGERIDVLYKQYPTGFLIEDEAPDRTKVGLALMELVRKRRLAVINPPISFVLQNKALLAVLWAMHIAGSTFFNQEEHRWIEQYILPTYLNTHGNATPFAGPYVIKPVYGHDGISITIRDRYEVIEQSNQDSYNDQTMIYQQYAPLPTATIQTEQGRTEVNLVYNCFMAGGIPSAIGIRASQKLIINDTSYFLPVCYTLASNTY